MMIETLFTHPTYDWKDNESHVLVTPMIQFQPHQQSNRRDTDTRHSNEDVDLWAGCFDDPVEGVREVLE